MTAPLLPTRFLFRFSAPCRRREPLWTPDDGGLDESYRLVGLAELEGPTAWADLRAAWSEAGLAFAVHVRKKKRGAKGDSPLLRQMGTVPFCPCSLHIWIDTRDVHNVHRAGRFCHQFRFTAKEGAGKANPKSEIRNSKKKGDQKGTAPFFPVLAEWLPINRAKGQPGPVPPEALQARCQAGDDGYVLEALIPAEALTGFDPAEHPRLGFTYEVIDGEFGAQTFGVGSPMPYDEDPSLWATLELTA